jgi:hypothetical protein
MAKKPAPMSRDTIGKTARSAVEDAVDFVQSEIAEPRLKAEKYFNGKVDLPAEPLRSKVVATRCRDVVRQVKPSLMRVFLYSDKAVEFAPVGPTDAATAEQATKYMHWKFGAELNGYLIQSAAFQDAMVKKVGIVKVWWEEQTKTTIHTFVDVTDDELMQIVEDPDVEVIEHAAVPAPGPTAPEIDPQTGMPIEAPPPMLHTLKVSRSRKKGDMAVTTVPPEEFFVNKEARSLDDAYVVAHVRDVRIADAMRMGFDLDDLQGAGLYSFKDEEEEEERRGFDVDPRTDEDKDADPTSELVTIAEAYMSLDVDGIGTPVMHRVTLAGSSLKLLDYEPVEDVPFAVFEVDPEPHAFFGRSLVDIVMEDQDACTSILRGLLDNVHMVNNVRLGIVEGAVNIEDALNGEIGAIVRMTQQGAIQPLEVPFIAGQTMPMLQYMDGMTEVKTGVTRASMGLDPDALQSTTRAAVTATVQAAAGQVEVMARNLAETGLRRMFQLMLRLYVKHVREPVMMRLHDGWVPVDPRTWNANMDVRVNVGLGTGREEEKAIALDGVIADQQAIVQAYGLQNGLVTLEHIRNARADRLLAAGIKSADRYYLPVDANTAEAVAQQQAQAQQAAAGQGAPDPTAGLVQAEQVKAQTKMASDQMQAQLKVQQMQLQDDLERDRMAQDLAIKVGEILAKYGMQIDTATIKAEQAAMRPMNGPGAPTGGPQGMPQ